MQREPILDRIFKRCDTVELRLDVRYPVGPGPHPALLWLGGGDWQRMTRQGGAELAGWLLAEGYALIPTDYRVAPLVRHPEPLRDVLAALRHLRTSAAELDLDPARLGLCGEGAGGHLAALAATCAGRADLRDEVEPQQDDRPWLAIAIGAPLDLTRHVEPFRAAASALLGVDPAADPARATAASPFHQLRQGAPPHLLVHGDLDRTVPLVQSRLYLDALRAVGIPCELEVVPGTGHEPAKLCADALARRRVREFLKKHRARAQLARP